jgi:sulfur carrier protein ThiS
VTVSLSLIVNGIPIKTDYFVEGFMDHVVNGMIEALEGTGKIKDMDLSIDGDEVVINLNGTIIPVNTFANKIIRGTIIGMVSTLKGITDVKELSIALHK